MGFTTRANIHHALWAADRVSSPPFHFCTVWHAIHTWTRGCQHLWWIVRWRHIDPTKKKVVQKGIYVFIYLFWRGNAFPRNRASAQAEACGRCQLCGVQRCNAQVWKAGRQEAFPDNHDSTACLLSSRGGCCLSLSHAPVQAWESGESGAYMVNWAGRKQLDNDGNLFWGYQTKQLLSLSAIHLSLPPPHVPLYLEELRVFEKAREEKNVSLLPNKWSQVRNL